MRLSSVQILKNLSAVLEKAESSLDKVLKVNAFLTSTDSFEDMNAGEQYSSTTRVCNARIPFYTDSTATFVIRFEHAFVWRHSSF